MLSHIWDICSDLLRTKFCISCHTGKFFDMNRGVTILFNYSFRDEYRILKVITIPWHKCDCQILSQCQLTHIGGWAICKNITTCYLIARFH